MKSLNIKIDEQLYEAIRALGFMRKEPIAVVVRQFLQQQVDSQPKVVKEKMALVLDVKDEKKVQKILAKDEWVSEEDFMKENNLTYNK